MSDHFSVVDGVISPSPWMQHRPTATGAAVSVSRNYSPSGGGNKDDLVQSVVVKWTNNTPDLQWVHGIVTRGGHQVALQARSRGYLSDIHAYVITNSSTTKPVDADYDLLEVSRSGIGMDAGKGGLLATGSGFCVAEKRENTTSAPFMPHAPGLIRVEAGKTLWARVDVRFRSEFWENTTVDGGSSSTESGFICGDTRLDLYAIPVFVDPGTRPTPTVVGVTHGTKVGAGTADVNVPAGTAAGDIILAFVAAQWGQLAALSPVQTGWTPIHSRDAGNNDVHLLLLARVAGASEPTKYTFNNAFAVEQITHLVTIRDASNMLDDGWYAASTLRKKRTDRDDGQIAPSIDRAAQLLLCMSYIGHNQSQAPITQASPVGMTEISDVSGTVSAAAIAVLPSPPRPSGARLFVPSKAPTWSGHLIALTVLIPGTRPI